MLKALNIFQLARENLNMFEIKSIKTWASDGNFFETHLYKQNKLNKNLTLFLNVKFSRTVTNNEWCLKMSPNRINSRVYSPVREIHLYAEANKENNSGTVIWESRLK